MIMENMMKLSKTMCVVLLCASLWGCHGQNTKKESVRTVRTDTVAVWGESVTSVFPGKVKASSDINVAFKVSGTIERVAVAEGNFVRRGDVLVEMDPRDYALQLAATEAEYTQLKGEAERVIALYEKGSVSQNDYEKALYGLRQITAKYDAHKNALEDTRLRAPFDGYVQKTFFRKGETVGAGMPVVSVISRDQPEVEINIPAADFVKREKFDHYTATVDIYPDTEFPLQLVGIGQKANLNQLYPVRLRLRASQNGILPAPGMSAMVTIHYRPEPSALVSVPVGAVFEKDGKSTVWVLDPDTQTVAARGVTLAEITTGGTVVLSSGVAKGEVVITAGVNSLKEGQRVKPLPAETITNIGNLL